MAQIVMKHEKKLISLIRSPSLPNILVSKNDQYNYPKKLERRASISTYLCPFFKRFINNKKKIRCELNCVKLC